MLKSKISKDCFVRWLLPPLAGLGEMGQMMSFPVFWCSIVTTRHTAQSSAAQYLLPPANSTTGIVIIYLYFLYKIISNGWIGLYHKSFWHFHNNHRPPSPITCFSDCQYYWTPPLQSSGSSRNVNIKTQIIIIKINIRHIAGNNTVAPQNIS